MTEWELGAEIIQLESPDIGSIDAGDSPLLAGSLLCLRKLDESVECRAVDFQSHSYLCPPVARLLRL